MPERKLRYEVDVDTSSAVSDLRRLGTEGEKAGRDLEKAFDKSASAGEKARQALIEVARAADSELREAAAAADALKAALGDAGERFDTNQIVADLNRMGVTFDEIRGDADRFATTLREVDGIRVQQVTDGLDDTKRALDDVGTSGDQSRSVLANLAGNAAQDLGELGGVVGTLGVGLGQMAEYATEGNIRLSELAKVAGPMAGIAAATALITRGLGEMARIDAWRTEQVEGYAAAIDEVGVGMDAVQQHLADVADESFAAGVGIEDAFTDILTGTDSIPNVAAAFGALGVDIRDVSAAVAAGAQDTDAGRAALDDLTAAIAANGVELGDNAQLLDFVREQQDAYAQAVADAAAEATFFRRSAADINDMLAEQAAQLRLHDLLWSAVVKDLADGEINTRNARDAYNQLQRELNLTDEAMDDLARQKVDEALEADAEAAEEAADAHAELAERLQETRQAATEANQIMRSADWGAAAAEGAATAWGEIVAAQFDHVDHVDAVLDAYDGLTEAMDAAEEEGLSFTDMFSDLESDEARAVQQALRGIADSYLPAVQNAFTNASGDVDVFKANMQDLADRTMRRLQDELGISAEDAAGMAAEILGIPSEWSTTYELMGDAEAVAKLELLQGVIDGLPADVQTEVAMHVLADDPQAAIAAIERAVAKGNYNASVDTTLGSDKQFRRSLAGQLYTAAVQPRLVTRGSPRGSPGDRRSAEPAALAASDTAGAIPVATTTSSSGAVFVTRAPAPVTINVSAAVIGSRFDVQRAVMRAVREAARLGG